LFDIFKDIRLVHIVKDLIICCFNRVFIGRWSGHG